MRQFIASGQALDWATAALVFIVAMIMGRYAAQGMNLIQWAGAAAAVLGSITVAVMVRVWPAPKTAQQPVRD